MTREQIALVSKKILNFKDLFEQPQNIIKCFSSLEQLTAKIHQVPYLDEVQDLYDSLVP